MTWLALIVGIYVGYLAVCWVVYQFFPDKEPEYGPPCGRGYHKLEASGGSFMSPNYRCRECGEYVDP